ncbi:MULTISPECIES: FtsH protease activity modulator HflK [Maritimibacter]|uniref:Protein HflK n=1 Tax=Maritimibacter alkaliphilus HTCC2654 TaxID=314271 RepID=A3VLW3_9RHOB|nr:MULTISPECIES: FtsH protease activity modulator HflK [Maritimibacter]EAQ10798.1 HflK protein [Rhodobacterales bacterium HTCC2654] [Maritimibacter alkaliphilus HTCC2654]MBL6429261.1 FtsH protease activity modulator HflK [Maritimibacter sp.]TYP81717.1 protease FtsH subunit HflK [Maritimibacter alkaliphilus HTCC2654]
MASDSGGPWGGGGGNRGGSNGGSNGGDDRNGQNGGNRRPGQQGGNIPEIDDLMRRGQEQLRVLMGGKGGANRGNGGGEGPAGPRFTRGTIGIVVLAAVALWLFASFYRVDTSEQSVELLFGERYQVGTEGLNFAPWPVVTKEIYPVTRENTEDIGVGLDEGLMLTGDENIVDIDYQVVWNIGDVEQFVFNLADPVNTIRAVSESAMREIIGRSSLAPILNRDRGVIAQELEELIQSTLDSYNSGVNIVRVNFDRADPPREVIDSFREVQAAEQTRDTLQSQADAYANRVVAEARGEAAQTLEQAEAYRARVVNEAEGEAARFIAVYNEYAKAPEVTRRRLYIETLERVLGDVDKIIMDDAVGGEQGVVPYLPLNELRRNSTNTTTSGGSN